MNTGLIRLIKHRMRKRLIEGFEMVSSLDEPMLVRVSQDNIDGIPVRNLWL